MQEFCVTKPNSLLNQLKDRSTLVVEYGEIPFLQALQPRDAFIDVHTVHHAVIQDEFEHLLENAADIAEGLELHGNDLIEAVADLVITLYGVKILGHIDGRIYIYLDARLSFDPEGLIARAKRLVNVLDSRKVDHDRVYWVIPATWEGIQAMSKLEEDGIHCVATFVFSIIQAMAAAENNISVINTYVGRIQDWYAEKIGSDFISRDDPGVLSASNIFKYIKKHGFNSEVMASSFRDEDQVVSMAGCDLIVLNPDILLDLSKDEIELENRLHFQPNGVKPLLRQNPDEKTFRWLINADPMATSKLAEGIRILANNRDRLEEMIEKELLDE